MKEIQQKYAAEAGKTWEIQKEYFTGWQTRGEGRLYSKVTGEKETL